MEKMYPVVGSKWRTPEGVVTYTGGDTTGEYLEFTNVDGSPISWFCGTWDQMTAQDMSADGETRIGTPGIYPLSEKWGRETCEKCCLPNDGEKVRNEPNCEC